MSKNSKFATISVAVFVGLFAVYLGGYQTGKSANPSTDTEQATLATPDAPVLAQTTEPQSGGERPAPQLAATDPEDVDPASIDWAALRERFGQGFDPMLVSLPTDRWGNPAVFTDEEIAAYNALHVVAFNPFVDSVCQNVSAALGDSATQCQDFKQRPKHPYADLGLAELYELAETDAVASVFASRKVESLEDKIGFGLRAAALSEKSGPIMSLAAVEFVSSHTIGASGTSEPIPNAIVSRMILEGIAKKLGDPRAKPEVLQSYIDEFVDTEEEKLQLLNGVEKAMRAALETMADIQKQVTGSTQVRELLDA
jgi:hypothetical protein